MSFLLLFESLSQFSTSMHTAAEVAKDNQINCKPCTYLENGQDFAVQRRQQRQQQQRQLNVIAFSLLKIPRRALTR